MSGPGSTPARTRDNETIQPGDVSLQRVIRFRGMSGNLAKPGGATARGDGSPSADADDPVDYGWLQGRTAETATYQPGGRARARCGSAAATPPTTGSPPLTRSDGRAGQGPPDLGRHQVTSTTDAQAGGMRDLQTTVTTAVDEGGETHRGVKAGAVTKVQTVATGARADVRHHHLGRRYRRWMDPGAARPGHQQSAATLSRATSMRVRVRPRHGPSPTTTNLDRRRVSWRVCRPRWWPTPDLPATLNSGIVTSLMAYDSWGRAHPDHRPARAGSRRSTTSPTNGLTTRVIATNAKGHRTTTEVGCVAWAAGGDARCQRRVHPDGLRLPGTPGHGPQARQHPAASAPSVEFGYSVNADQPSRVKTTVQRAGNATDASFGFTDGWGRTITTLTPVSR